MVQAKVWLAKSQYCSKEYLEETIRRLNKICNSLPKEWGGSIQILTEAQDALADIKEIVIE